jgi:Lsr2
VARKELVQLLDDIDQSEADETIQFALDGTQYEIDLNKAHAKDLRSVLDTYVKSARRIDGGRVRSSGRRRGGAAAGDRDQIKAIREWAKQAGHTVSARGRIPAKIKQAFEEAQRR